MDGSTETRGPWLAVDYGRKRVGLAISDAEARFALPLETLDRTSDRQVVDALRDLVEQEGVVGLFVGEPKHLDGSVGEAAERVRRFARELADTVNAEVRLIDEALTSHEAEARLRAADIDPRKQPRKIDQIAAQILLEDGLEQVRGGR